MEKQNQRERRTEEGKKERRNKGKEERQKRKGEKVEEKEYLPIPTWKPIDTKGG